VRSRGEDHGVNTHHEHARPEVGVSLELRRGLVEDRNDAREQQGEDREHEPVPGCRYRPDEHVQGIRPRQRSQSEEGDGLVGGSGAGLEVGGGIPLVLAPGEAVPEALTGGSGRRAAGDAVSAGRNLQKLSLKRIVTSIDPCEVLGDPPRFCYWRSGAGGPCWWKRATRRRRRCSCRKGEVREVSQTDRHPSDPS
jgi:hypothetical protein